MQYRNGQGQRCRLLVVVEGTAAAATPEQAAEALREWYLRREPMLTPAEHQAALSELEGLIVADPMPGTEASERLDVLVRKVERYEAAHYPMGAPTPREAVAFRLEQQGLPAGKVGELVQFMTTYAGTAPVPELERAVREWFKGALATL